MLCTICGVNEVKDEEQDFCIICHFSGKRFEAFLLDEERSNVLGRIREMPHVTQAVVWHQGGGAFQLGVMLDDGRLVAPGWAVEGPGGEVMVASAIPPVSDKWAVSLTNSTQDSASLLAGTYDDEELVAVVGRIVEGNLADEDVPDLGL